MDGRDRGWHHSLCPFSLSYLLFSLFMKGLRQDRTVDVTVLGHGGTAAPLARMVFLYSTT